MKLYNSVDAYERKMALQKDRALKTTVYTIELNSYEISSNRDCSIPEYVFDSKQKAINKFNKLINSSVKTLQWITIYTLKQWTDSYSNFILAQWSSVVGVEIDIEHLVKIQKKETSPS